MKRSFACELHGRIRGSRVTAPLHRH
jgi:hypothetical protein